MLLVHGLPLGSSGGKKPQDSPCYFKGIAASAGWTWILLVAACSSWFLKTCAYHSAVVWLMALLPAWGSPPETEELPRVELKTPCYNQCWGTPVPGGGSPAGPSRAAPPATAPTSRSSGSTGALLRLQLWANTWEVGWKELPWNPWEQHQGFLESPSLLLIRHRFLMQVLSFLYSLIKALISLNDEKLTRHQNIKHAEATILLLSKRAWLAFARVRAPCWVKRKNHVLHQHFTVKFKLSVPPGKSWCNTQTVPVNRSLVNV